MQVLVAGKPTGVLSVFHPSGRTFRAYLENGQLVHAVYDTATGLDALAVLMRDQSGTFEFRSGERTTERSIQTTPEWALMQAVHKAEQLPPSLHTEVRIKRKTPPSNLPQVHSSNPRELPASEQVLGRTPQQPELPRSARAAAGSNATTIESLASMLKSPVTSLGSGLLAGAAATGRSGTVSIASDQKSGADQLLVDLEFDDDDATRAEPQAPRHPSNPSRGPGADANPTAFGVAMIPIRISISSDPNERRSQMPARVLEAWLASLNRPVARFELRKVMDRRGLILPVTADARLESELVIPGELAERLKIASGSTVWIGPG